MCVTKAGKNFIDSYENLIVIENLEFDETIQAWSYGKLHICNKALRKNTRKIENRKKFRGCRTMVSKTIPG